VQKQALLLESSLNRHALISEIDALRSSAARLSNAIRAPRYFVPLLVGVASLAGFLAFRGVRRPVSLFTRLASAAKWIGPAYSLWRSFSAARQRDADAP